MENEIKKIFRDLNLKIASITQENNQIKIQFIKNYNFGINKIFNNNFKYFNLLNGTKTFNYKQQHFISIDKSINFQILKNNLNNKINQSKKELFNFQNFLNNELNNFYLFLEKNSFNKKEFDYKISNCILGKTKLDTTQEIKQRINDIINDCNLKISIQNISQELQLSNYQNTFIEARSLNREIEIFVGPTNSGKTYAAFEEIKKFNSGAYLAPLRLLAREGADKLFEKGILSNLLTGEERIRINGATFDSCTIEMLNLEKKYDCVVIDEIQMLNDEQRGWAWTQAVVGAKAKKLILVGSEEILPKLLPLLDTLNEKYSVKKFTRKQDLIFTPPLNGDLTKLQKGDCLVVFSRKEAIFLKDELKKIGFNPSVVYGNLSPEIRVLQANKFNSNKTDILIATDAIGMGLNLPIKRVIFTKSEKFNGKIVTDLEETLVKQISGRAGRYGVVDEVGEVTTLYNQDWQKIKTSFHCYYKTNNYKLFIKPTFEHLNYIIKKLNFNNNCSNAQAMKNALLFFKENLIKDHDLYEVANINEMNYVLSHLKNSKLSLQDVYYFSVSPIDVNNELMSKNIFYWAKCFEQNKEIKLPKYQENLNTSNDYDLFYAESYVKILNLYKWFYFHYPELFTSFKEANEKLKEVNNFIESALSSHQSQKKLSLRK